MPPLPIAARRTILHIGPPKTGTTTLQELVFPALKTVCFLGKPWWNPQVPYDKCVALHRAIDSVTKASDSEYDADAAAFAVQDWLAHAPAAQMQEDGSHLPLMLSEERLAFSDVVSLETIAARLAKLFPGAEIVYARREPVSGLRSFHRWLYARAWIDTGFSDWLREGLSGHEAGFAAVALRSYDWPLVERSFGQHFPTVRSVDFRHMLKDPPDFLAQMIGSPAAEYEAFSWLKDRPLNVSRGRSASELHRATKKLIRVWNRLPFRNIDEKREYIGDTAMWKKLERLASVLPFSEGKLTPSDADRQLIQDYYANADSRRNFQTMPTGQRAQS